MARTGTLTATARDAEAILESLRQPERFAEIFDRHFSSVHRYLALCGAGAS
jgi:hypothetical protein